MTPMYSETAMTVWALISSKRVSDFMEQHIDEAKELIDKGSFVPSGTFLGFLESNKILLLEEYEDE